MIHVLRHKVGPKIPDRFHEPFALSLAPGDGEDQVLVIKCPFWLLDSRQEATVWTHTPLLDR